MQGLDGRGSNSVHLSLEDVIARRRISPLQFARSLLDSTVNIIRLCPVYYPYSIHGGSVIADYELDKAMVAEGHSVDVMTCKNKSDDFGFTSIASDHTINYFPAYGSELHGISLRVLFRLFKTLFKNKDKVDLVWFGGVWNLMTIFGPYICRLFSVKYIITPHGMLIPHLIALKSSRAKNYVIRLFLKSSLSNAYRVHFTVDKEYHETREATGATMNPVVFPLFFDLKSFDLNSSESNNLDPASVDSNSLEVKGQRSGSQIDEEKIILSFVGRITGKKRLDLVFAALKSLPEEIKSKLEFQIAGPNAEDLWDGELYSEDNIGLPVKYFGPLYDQDLARLYHNSDIFILCSESENFAISVVEAAYCYTVPLITKAVGVSEYFPDESAVYAELDQKDIAKKIQYLVNNPEKMAQYKCAARSVSEQFDTSFLPESYFLKKLL